MSTLSRLLDLPPRQTVQYLRYNLTGRSRLQAFDNEHPCVYVLSTGRAGTRTLGAFFGLADNVFAYHGLAPTLYALSRLAYELGGDAGTRHLLKDAFLEARSPILDHSLRCGKGYIETGPQATFLGPVIADAVPGVRFIHLVRDPRDVVRSAMRRNWYRGHPNDKTRIVPLRGSDTARQWESYSVFRKNLWLWQETNSWVARVCAGLPPDRLLLVHAEDLFQGKAETIAELMNFVGAPSPAAGDVTRVLAKRLNAQKTGVFPEPSLWPEEMRRDVAEIAGPMARVLGYEPM